MSKSISCPRCGASNEAGEYHCSSCKFNLSVKYTPPPGESRPAAIVDGKSDAVVDGVGPQKGSTSGPATSVERATASGSPEGGQHKIASVLLSRYRDAYKHANSIASAGSALKIIGWILAALIVLGGIMTKNGQAIAASIVVAFGTGSGFNFMGVGIAAQGQVMLASLDTAVNTSPFLDDSQKTQILTSV